MQYIKEETIGGELYKFKSLAADSGSWMLMRLMKTFRDYLKTLNEEGEESQGMVEPEDFAETLLQQLLFELDEMSYKKIQKYLLQTVFRVDGVGDVTHDQPIMVASGAFAFADLAANHSLISTLTSQALFANFSSVFTKAGLQAMMTGQIPQVQN